MCTYVLRVQGALRRGHDLRVANCTVDMAETWCRANDLCAGFTLRVASGDRDVRQVYFKDGQGSLVPNSDPTWETYVKAGSAM